MIILKFSLGFRTSYLRCSIKKQFLKISQNLRKTPVSESHFNKVIFL